MSVTHLIVYSKRDIEFLYGVESESNFEEFEKQVSTLPCIKGIRQEVHSISKVDSLFKKALKLTRGHSLNEATQATAAKAKALIQTYAEVASGHLKLCDDTLNRYCAVRQSLKGGKAAEAANLFTEIKAYAALIHQHSDDLEKQSSELRKTAAKLFIEIFDQDQLSQEALNTVGKLVNAFANAEDFWFKVKSGLSARDLDSLKENALPAAYLDWVGLERMHQKIIVKLRPGLI